VLIHQALDRFVTAFPRALPADAEARLLALGREAFGALLSRPGIWAFWWPRFERIALWFLDQERERRHTLAALVSETSGSRVFPAPGGDFELNAKADRIERRADGLVIVDYKTGTLPRDTWVKRGLAPQLPLEAAIAEAGGFCGVPAAPVASLEYWRLSGLAVPGELKCIAEGAAARALIAAALAGLEALIARFDDPTTPYRAVPIAKNAPRYSDYEHLERVKEWRATEVAEEA
jgi:ATP-dependent helicase/nuclease subunit B